MKIRFLLLAALLLAVICLFVGCDSDDNGEIPEETLPPVENIVFAGGEVQYTIVRPDSADDDVRSAATKLYTALNKYSKVGVGTDWLKPGDPVPEFEILLGDVEREESKGMFYDVPAVGFAIRVVGQKLVILPSQPDCADEAVDYLIGLCAEQGLVLPENDLNAGNYPLGSVKLGGTPISEYEICSSEGELAAMLQQQIAALTSYRLRISSETADSPQIILGQSAKQGVELKYYDYTIESDGKNVYINGYGKHETGHAIKIFIEMIQNAAGYDLVLTETLDSYTLPDREEYIKDPSKLYMLWDYIWEAPEWMLDYESKKTDIFGGKGSQKLYASAHRAEQVYYPENSIEAVISTYYMGAAIAELDFGVTKDGVLVLLHDPGFTRTTNVKDYVGKPGYPDSTKVGDWTYEQLQVLNLKEGDGGDSARLTPFKVATLEEALTVCKDRLFIVPDKYANWQYIKSDDVMQESAENYLVDVMKKTGNFESIIISYGKSVDNNYLSAVDAVKIQKLLKAETGVTPFIMVRSGVDSTKRSFEYLLQNAEPASFTIQFNGEMDKKTNYEPFYREYGDRVAFLVWTINSGDDIRKNWEWIYENGLRVIMTNELLDLCQYCAEVGEGTP